MSNAAKKTLNGRADDTTSVATEERWHMIAEAAYYRAVNRSFQNGDPMVDWLVAEREVDTLLLSQPASPVKASEKTELVAPPAKTRNPETASRARR